MWAHRTTRNENTTNAKGNSKPPPTQPRDLKITMGVRARSRLSPSGCTCQKKRLQPLLFTLLMITECAYPSGEALTMITEVRDRERSYQLKMPIKYVCKVQHVPQNGSVNVYKTLSVFSGAFHCCDRQVISFGFLTSCVQINVPLRPLFLSQFVQKFPYWCDKHLI